MSNGVDIARPAEAGSQALAAFAGGRGGGTLSVRRIAGLLDAPGCARRRVIDAAAVPIEPLAELLGCPPGRQSPFAHARTRTFTRLCTGGAMEPLRDLVRDRLGVTVTGSRRVELAGSGGVAERAERTDRELAEILAMTDPVLHVLVDPVLSLTIAGRPVRVESPALILLSGAPIHLVELRTFACVDGVADPAQVAQAARHLAVSVCALRERSGPAADRIATAGLLVMPENFALAATGSVLDAAPQVRRLRRLLAAPVDVATAAPLPAPAPADADPAAVAAVAGAAAAAVGALASRFGDGCLNCPLFGFCRREHTAADAVERVGTDAANLCGGAVSVEAALALAEGGRAPIGPGEEAVAVGLSRAAAALDLVT